MLTTLWNLGAFVIVLGLLVTVHEFGHFWVARRCGVKVHRFSIGFGKVLFSWNDRQGTEFVVAAIPLGGYVKMLDGRIDSLCEAEQPFAFDQKSVWQRIAIVVAGPLANFLLAIVAFSLMYIIGVNSAKPIIKSTLANTPMSVIKNNDSFQVVAINEQRVDDWESLNLALVGQIGESELKITITPLTADKNTHVVEPTETFIVSLQNWKFDPKKESIITSLGLLPYTPDVHLQIANLTADGAAAQAGLQVGDKLLAIDGVELTDWQEFVSMIQKNAKQTLQVNILRDGVVNTLPLTPVVRKSNSGIEQGYIGVAPVVDVYPQEYRIRLQFSPLQAVIKGVKKTGQLTKLTFDTLIKLVIGDISVKNLSGPVAIAKGAGMSAGYGIEYFLGFLGLISVNLGLMNLIPLPVLDGGHLLYYAIEVLTGRPVPERIQEIGFKIGGAILITLMVIAVLNDFNAL